MRAAILCPRRSGIADRDRLWAHCRDWWREHFPDWALVEGEHVEHEGPFNRSVAINRAAVLAFTYDPEVLIIIDGDVLPDPAAVARGVDLAASSGAMVLAFDERVHLNTRGTERVLSGYRGRWDRPEFVERRHNDSCSSLVIVSRALWDMVGGFDPEFVGWGWEDVAFRVACETMSGRPVERVRATLWHLWHKVSAGNNVREETFQRNRARGERYKRAHWDRAAVAAILEGRDEPLPDWETTIPRVLHRTVPLEVDDEAERWWARWAELLGPAWALHTWRDPLDPEDFPITADLWDRCANGAQLAGLVRLEVLWHHGGVYVDADVEPYRGLEPLLGARGFAAWEDAGVVPDAVLGAMPGHPAVEVMLTRARQLMLDGADAWHTGPGVSTWTLPGRPDWLLLPPGSFYPYHYTERHKRAHDHMSAQPWAFGAHHWAGSWLSDEQLRAQTNRPPARVAPARRSARERALG